VTTGPELLAALSLATDLGSGRPLEHALYTCLIADRLAEAGDASRGERDVTYPMALLHAIGCTAGAHEVEVARRLAERLGLNAFVQDALLHAFERWDGKGFPRGIAGEAIPLPARLMQVARDAYSVALDAGPAAAVKAVRTRSAYDPAIAALLTEAMLEPPAEGVWSAVIAAAPDRRRLTGRALDEACAVAGDFADLTSPWTLGHSAGVADLAEAAAWRRALPFEEVDAVRRAALVHDLGRAGVARAVWDRPGPLSEADRGRVRLHPTSPSARSPAATAWRRSAGSAAPTTSGSTARVTTAAAPAPSSAPQRG
jgi:HD-GYP domain-containing protein (c-di-GMP phosphodiesterase class II)